MGPTSANDAGGLLSPPLRAQLLTVAAEAIRAGLSGARWQPRLGDYAEPLRQPRASFVTLRLGAALRGCVGNLDTLLPLVQDVAHNARAAAFEDPRFAPLTQVEFVRLDIHLALLNPPQPIPCASEAEALAQLRPQIDGVVLVDGACRGTFLPSVWRELPEPRTFLHQLKRKAGLPEEHWSNTLRLWRYTVESVP